MAAYDAHANHTEGGNHVANGEHALRLNETVGQDTHYGWHENGDYALNGVEPTDVGSHTFASQKTTHRNEISTPHGKLQEVHTDKASFD